MNPDRRKVHPMTRKKLAPLVVALLMTAPAMAILPAAEAQNIVPGTPNVSWTNETTHATTLYAVLPTFEDTSTVDCPDGGDAVTGEIGIDGARLSVTPAPSENDFRQPRQCSFGSGGATDPRTSGISFSFDPMRGDDGVAGLLHGFNVTGNRSIEYHHFGTVPAGVTLTVTLKTQFSTVGTLTIQGDGDNTYDKGFEIPERFEFRRGDVLTLDITGSSQGGGTGGLPVGTPPSWTLSDGGLTGSRLVVKAPEAVKTATWVRDQDGTVRSLFRPDEPNRTAGARIEGVFAIQSAFGLPDAQLGGDPVFTLFRANDVVLIGPQRLNTLTGAFSPTLSQASQGRAAWTFPAGYWDYKNVPGGEYVVRVNKADHQGGGYAGLGVEHKFFISAQSVVVKPYDDSDPLTLPSPLESAGHSLAPGGETTYVLLVNNTGFVTDTFRVDVQFVSGSPGSGWSAVVGGPNVLGGEVVLAPNEQKLVTVRVAAPQGTVIGDSAIHQVRATSRVDPTSTSSTVTLVSTVSSEVTTGVDLIVAKTTEELEPGLDHTYTIYAWNRGSRTANLTLDLQETPRAGWNVNLLLGQLGVKSLQLANVRPGDIAKADVRVSGPVSGVNGENRVTFVATNTDLGGVTRSIDVVYRLVGSAAVKVEILDKINGVGHYVETHPGTVDGPDGTGSAPSPDCVDPVGVGDTPCNEDGASGVWFRAWVTNTGKRSDVFQLSLDTADWARCSGNADEVFANGGSHAVADDHFQIYHRALDGSRPRTDSIELNPGETGEVYVFVSVDATGTLRCAEDYFSFVLTATGRDTGALGRAGTRVVAENRAEPVTLVLLEPVGRLEGYNVSKPLVDASRVGKRNVKGGVEVNGTAYYYVRVTNGAAWAAYDDANGNRVRPEVKLNIDGIDVEDGWNVSMRQVVPGMNATFPPYNSTVVITPPDDRRHAWEDYEIEIRVDAPKVENGTALAGEKDQILLKAEIGRRLATSSLEIETEIRQLRDIKLEIDNRNLLAHPGEPTAALVLVGNEGSITGDVTLRARMDDDRTFNAGAWRVEPAEQAFNLAAFKNRSVAILVTPPGNAIQGQRGVVNVSVEYQADPLDATTRRNVTLEIDVEVTALGTIQLDATQFETTIVPGGFANFTMTLRNSGGVPVQYRITGTPIPNWTQTLSSTEASLDGGATRQVVYVLQAPFDVTNESRFASVVRVSEVGNDANFDVVPFHVNIRGGQAIASLSAPVITKTVDRAGVQNFEVLVKNVGSKLDTLPLQVRSEDPMWSVSVTNARNEPISSVTLGPNELVPVNVTVRAPLVVSENKLTKVELTAFSPDFGQSAKVTLDALIHDYGVELDAVSTRVDAFAGAPTEFILKLRNTGNDNDTLNVSAILTDIPEWNVTFSSDQVRLEPGQEVEVRATVKPPRTPLPSARAYNFRLYAGTIGGAEVNVTKNDTLAATVNVLEYRSLDVDGDGFLEIAVNENKQAADGFETFREIFTDGAQTTVVARAPLNGKMRFFLDVPGQNPYDGIADRWFDPESVYSYRVQHAIDLNGDASPDYLVDSNRDLKIDLAYDTEGERYWTVVEVKAFGDDRIQYLVDTNADGRPDRFYDPETKTVTRILPQTSTNVLGIDTDNDGRVNKFYDTKTGDVTDAKVRNFSDFAKDYWYFFVLFAAFALVSIALLVRRFRD